MSQPDLDRQGERETPNLDRQGETLNLDRQGETLNLDRQGETPNLDRQGETPNLDRQGETPNLDRQGETPNLDRQGETLNLDRQGKEEEAHAPSLTVGVRDEFGGGPLAYFITFRTYGTWLHGHDAGSVDREHNMIGTPMLPTDPEREAYERSLMDQPPYALDAARRDVVLAAIQEVCHHRNWVLLAAHVRTTHAHVVVQAVAKPEKVMNDFKAYASRSLNQVGFENSERKRWTRHGSTLYLWKRDEVVAAIHYVVYEQGVPMAVYENTTWENRDQQ
ncbi:MAG: transposase [Caldilineales bacterium]|nr:transposase [Caldilineales bacterium]